MARRNPNNRTAETDIFMSANAILLHIRDETVAEKGNKRFVLSRRR
jgi:hypothetical protein